MPDDAALIRPTCTIRRESLTFQVTMSDDTRQQIKQICLNLLTRSELSRHLLAKKLSDRGYALNIVLKVIDELEEQGWQSDQRYMDQYIAMRTRKGFGPVRIQMELEQRGIDTVSAQSAVQALQWQDTIAQAYRKKYNTGLKADWSERARRMRFLQYRGFTTQQINDFMQTLDQPPGNAE